MPLVTIQEVFDKAMALIDEVSVNGAPVSTASLEDFKLKGYDLMTLTLEEINYLNDVNSEFEVSWSPIQNALGEQWQVQRFTGDDKSYEKVGAKCYSYEVEDEGVQYVEEETAPGVWTILETITVTAEETADGMIRKYGVITASDTSNKIRLRFSGTYVYMFQNVFMSELPFKLANVPYYRRYFPVDMPSDFQSVEQLVEESELQHYSYIGHYKWENYNQLYVSWDFDGTYRVLYKPEPFRITALTDQVNMKKELLVLVAYKLAGEIAIHEQRRNASYFFSKFDELKAQMERHTPEPEQEIVNLYGDFGGSAYDYGEY